MQKDTIKELISPTESYYDFCGYSTLELMYSLYGKEELMSFCKLNAFKYRLRIAKKTTDYERDISKAIYYEELWNKFNKLI